MPNAPRTVTTGAERWSLSPLLGAGLMVVCFIATLFLKEIPLRKSNKPGEGASAVSPELEAEAQTEEAIATFGM